MFDIKQLKVSEIKIIEQASGKKFTEIFSENPDTAALAVVVWVVEKRSNPSLGLVDVEDRTLGEILAFFGLDETAPLEIAE